MIVFSFGAIYSVSIKTQAPIAETTATPNSSQQQEGPDLHLGWFALLFCILSRSSDRATFTALEHKQNAC